MKSCVSWIEQLLEEFKEIDAEIAAGKIQPPTDFEVRRVEVEPIKNISQTYMDMLAFSPKKFHMSDAFINRVKPLLDAELAKRRPAQNRVAEFLQPAVAFSKDKNASDNDKKRMDSALERILKQIENEEGDETDK
jgi:hypothetical protein